MSKPKVYIDGKEGTTGLQIYDRLAVRDDIELLLIEEDKRKDIDERKKLINAADLVFLCLPDAAAIESVSLIENENTRVIDASTAAASGRQRNTRSAALISFFRSSKSFLLSSSISSRSMSSRTDKRS